MSMFASITIPIFDHSDRLTELQKESLEKALRDVDFGTLASQAVHKQVKLKGAMLKQALRKVSFGLPDIDRKTADR